MEKDPFKEYLKESEPDKVEKGYAWSTAIGLQAVDGLKSSQYLFQDCGKFIFFAKAIQEQQQCTNLQKGVYETTEYLEIFLRNMLLNEKNELRNRDLHINVDMGNIL